MKRVLCPKIPSPGSPTELPESEAEHAIRVFRLRDGDRVEALDGKGHSAIVTLRVKGDSVRLEFADHATANLGDLPPITLEMSILKGDAMEWVVEKSVELGVKKLVPLVTAHTVVQVKQKGPEAFQQRWQKIADQALKQCGRLEALQIELPLELETHLSRSPADSENPRLWCDEADRETIAPLERWLIENSFQSLRILIGPEGGWSFPERDLLHASAGVSKVGLGPWVLRAETAALFAVSLAASRFRLKT